MMKIDKMNEELNARLKRELKAWRNSKLKPVNPFPKRVYTVKFAKEIQI